MNEEKFSNDIISKVFKVEVNEDLKNKYFQFLSSVKQYLKENYEKYFLCIIILQDKNNKNIFYPVEVYNNLIDIDNTYAEVSEIIDKKYKEEFGNKINRVQIEDISEIKNIFP